MEQNSFSYFSSLLKNAFEVKSAWMYFQSESTCNNFKIESAICIRESELGILFILKSQNKVEFNDLNLVVNKVKW